mmetsp:Transcript_28761/g.81095  ORF Transcript_28761/g.81095 Transcript_28761/m.81095 type:complete len:200 (-) Transcript_28761:2069-2668(-)
MGLLRLQQTSANAPSSPDAMFVAVDSNVFTDVSLVNPSKASGEICNIVSGNQISSKSEKSDGDSTPPPNSSSRGLFLKSKDFGFHEDAVVVEVAGSNVAVFGIWMRSLSRQSMDSSSSLQMQTSQKSSRNSTSSFQKTRAVSMVYSVVESLIASVMTTPAVLLSCAKEDPAVVSASSYDAEVAPTASNPPFASSVLGTK